MVNQDAVQILPPKPKIPTKPTTSCIKPTFNEKQKKGKNIIVGGLNQGCYYARPQYFTLAIKIYR